MTTFLPSSAISLGGMERVLPVKSIAHQQGFDQVVAVVAERDLAASQVWAACGASFSPIATTSPRR